jgi:hypothetical protein
MNDIPFGVIEWRHVEQTGHKGEAGSAYWRTRYFQVADNAERHRSCTMIGAKLFIVD